MLFAEAQQVIGLRLFGALTGKPLDLASLSREKAATAVKATNAAARSLVGGGGPVAAASKSLQVYRRKVKANRRKLSR